MIAIIKYNAGNIRSVQNALQRLGYESIITDDKDEILKAEKVIFPGVGEASSAMKYIKKKELDKVNNLSETAGSGDMPWSSADEQILGGR